MAQNAEQRLEREVQDKRASYDRMMELFQQLTAAEAGRKGRDDEGESVRRWVLRARAAGSYWQSCGWPLRTERRQWEEQRKSFNKTISDQKKEFQEVRDEEEASPEGGSVPDSSKGHRAECP